MCTLHNFVRLYVKKEKKKEKEKGNSIYFELEIFGAEEEVSKENGIEQHNHGQGFSLVFFWTFE